MINKLLSESFQYDGSETIDSLFNSKLLHTGLTKTQFERLTGMDRKSLNGILENTSKQTDIIKLLKLAEFLELEISDMLKIYLYNRPKEEFSELQKVIELTFITNYFDLKSLRQVGFISKDDNLDVIKDRITKFFKLDSIYDFQRSLNSVLYSKTKRPFNNKMIDFWVKSAYKFFENIENPNDFNRESLLELLPKIKPYTQNVENGLKTVFQALFNIGVTVVFQPVLPNTQIRGATLVVNNKPCIVITDFRKNYANFWFALIHELHHVLFDIETIQKSMFHLTGEPDLFLIQEEKADEFASEYLFSNEKMRYIQNFIHNPYMVEQFAKECQIHPCIIYSQFQWRQYQLGNNFWSSFKDFFPNINNLTMRLNLFNWQVENIEEVALKTKQVLSI